MDYKLGALFAKDHPSGNSRATESMNEEIRKVGGLLHFTIQSDASGWHAECVEIDGLITGGKNSHPTEDEVQANIRETIHTAFNITTERDEKPIVNANDYQAVYSYAPTAATS